MIGDFSIMTSWSQRSWVRCSPSERSLPLAHSGQNPSRASFRALSAPRASALRALHRHSTATSHGRHHGHRPLPAGVSSIANVGFLAPVADCRARYPIIADAITAAFLPHRLRRLSAATAIIVTAARTPAALPTTAIAADPSLRRHPSSPALDWPPTLPPSSSTSAWQTFSFGANHLVAVCLCWWAWACVLVGLSACVCGCAV